MQLCSAIVVKMAASAKAANIKCEICKEIIARYRCPRCKIQTCSVNCVKQHKIDRNCDGIRDKTEYVKKSKFTDMTLQSDYRFLEDAGRHVDNVERVRGPKFERVPYWTQRLGIECKRRGIHLKIMPPKFTKRKQNTTKFIQAKRKIFWHIEWKFSRADGSLNDTKISEDFLLREVLQRLLSSNNSLKRYLSVELDDICVLIQMVKRCANRKLYSLLDLNKTICENLQGKTIIEFPTFYVIFKHELHNYKIENETETISEDKNVNQDENNDTNTEQNLNEFSISDSSDDEIHISGPNQNEIETISDEKNMNQYVNNAPKEENLDAISISDSSDDEIFRKFTNKLQSINN